MTAYAGVDDLEDFLDQSAPDAPSEAAALRMLARASELLDDIVVRSFAVDPVTTLPLDEEWAEALRDACCAQVEFWFEVGEANDVDGLAGTQASLGSYSGLRAPVVAPRALRILRSAGLMVGP